MPRVAVIGIGHWGPNIIRNLAEIEPASIAWACDLDPKRLASIRQEYPYILTTTSYDEILHDPGIDAIMLSLPPAIHHAFALRALRAGKHLFVEKPVSFEPEQVKEIAEAARAAGRIFMVGLVYRYNMVIDMMNRLLAEGRIGTVLKVISWRTNLNQRSKHVNILWSLLPHDISIFEHWFGGPPSDVRALALASRFNHLEDEAHIEMRFGGVHCEVVLSWNDPVKKRRICVMGNKGTLLYDEIEYPGRLFVFPPKPNRENPRLNSCNLQILTDELGPPLETTRVNEPHEPLRNECRHFLECVRMGISPRTGGLEAIEVTNVIRRIISTYVRDSETRV